MRPKAFIADRLRHSRLRCAASCAVLLASCGCHATGFPDLAKFAASASDSTAATDSSKSSARPAIDEVARQLQGDAWFTTIRSTRHTTSIDDNHTPSAHRWQHPGLEQLLRRAPAERGDLRPLLDHTDRTIAAAAAVGLARTGDLTGTDQLSRTVRDVQAKLSLRQAAAEALGEVPDPSLHAVLLTLLSEFGTFDAGGRGYVPELHAELLRSLARHVDAGSEPQFNHALRSPAPEVRLVALQAWAQSQQGSLPDMVSDLLYDPQAEVRVASLSALVARQPDVAAELVTRALHDHELSVRLAAVAALGELASDDARSQLRTLLEDRAELIRAAAVSALFVAGDTSSALAAVDDASWRVREVIARQLATISDGSADPTVRRLLNDPSPQVQQQTIATLGVWPIERSAPLLLFSVEHASYAARKDAIALLARHVPAVRDFPVDAPADRRIEAFAALEQACAQSLGTLGRVHPLQPTATEPSTTVTTAQLDHVAACIQTLQRATDDSSMQHALAQLSALDGQLAPALEALASQDQLALPAVLYDDLLPRHTPIFDTLRQLQSPDRDIRRRAAHNLTSQLQETPLSNLALHRLSTIVTHESDDVVWRSIMELLAADARQPVADLAYAGLSHPSVDVRVRCCNHLARHPSAAHTPLLIPSLDDENRLVKLAALRALAACPPASDVEPLVRLLASRDRELQLHVARTLILWQDDRGRAALERLAYDVDARIQQRAVELMGELPDSLYTPTLIAALDGSPSLRRAALRSLAPTVGQDHGRSPDDPSPNAADQAARWKAWWQITAALENPVRSAPR